MQGTRKQSPLLLVINHQNYAVGSSCFPKDYAWTCSIWQQWHINVRTENKDHLMHRNEHFQSSSGKNLDLCVENIISCEVLEKTLTYMWRKSRQTKFIIMANWVGGATWCFPKNYSEWALLDKYENGDMCGLSYIVSYSLSL